MNDLQMMNSRICGALHLHCVRVTWVCLSPRLYEHYSLPAPPLSYSSQSTQLTSISLLPAHFECVSSLMLLTKKRGTKRSKDDGTSSGASRGRGRPMKRPSELVPSRADKETTPETATLRASHENGSATAPNFLCWKSCLSKSSSTSSSSASRQI